MSRIKPIGKNQLLSLLDVMPGTLFQYQEWPDGRSCFPYTTDSIVNFFFTTSEKLATDAQPIWEVLTTGSARLLRNKIDRSRDTLQPFEAIVQTHSPQNILCWIRIHAAPEKMEDGSVLWLGHMENTTSEQLNKEQALREAKKQIKETSVLTEAVIRSLPDQFYFKDRDARVLGGNPIWVKECGKSDVEELIGKTDLEIHSGPLGKQLYENELRIMESGETARFREQHKKEDGTIEFYESIKAPLTNNSGDVIGLVGITRDITRQALNEQELLTAREEAEAASKAKSSFLAMMSHEIRTPMNGVIGVASLLLGTSLTDEQEEFVHTIQVSGESLLSLINDILDYSKIEAGKIELESIPFSLRECIADSFDLFVQQASKKNLELVYFVEPNIPPMLEGDPARLRQIMINLIGNAIKFTEEGEISLNVQLLRSDKKTNSSTLQFSVRDTGIGISPEAQKKLFHSFTQADASSTRKYGGTGLGLAITRRLTELMGGKIWIESLENEGSTFHFTVTFQTSAITEPQKAPISPKELRGKRILIVDDNETNRIILSKQLELWGVTSRMMAHPDQVMDHLRQADPYDMILMDYHMPSIDGATLAKSIYDMPDYPRIPLIILSSSMESFPSHPAISARMNKPVKMDRLQEQILALLGHHADAADKSADAATHIRKKRTHSRRILVAEDNPINRRVVQIMLKKAGYEKTVYVEDGQQAVAAVLDSDFDVILMDVQMPQMNGLDATRQIREHSKNATIPWIIALTAGVMEQEQKAIFESGMNAFLPKPISFEQLAKHLDEFDKPE